MPDIKSIEKRISSIEERNAKVESDKSWETSWTRRILLMIFTYLAIALYLVLISVPNPWLSAIVPAVGFMLSTLTLPIFKNIWLRYFYKR